MYYFFTSFTTKHRPPSGIKGTDRDVRGQDEMGREEEEDGHERESRGERGDRVNPHCANTLNNHTLIGGASKLGALRVITKMTYRKIYLLLSLWIITMIIAEFVL